MSLLYRVIVSLIVIATSLMSAGCMVGPNFRTPSAPKMSRLTSTPLPSQTSQAPGIKSAGQSQSFNDKAGIPSAWWQLFHSNELNQLIILGLAHNQDLASAYASLRSAQEILNAQIGETLLPTFDLSLAGQRNKTSNVNSGGGATASIFNLFNSSVNVAYTFDLFGGARREIERLRAQVNYQQFQLIAVYMTLTTNIVTTAITQASLDEQIVITKKIILAQEKQLELINKQFKLGSVSNNDVLKQTSLVNQSKVSLTQLQKQSAINHHALSVLIGAYPDYQIPKVDINVLVLPRSLPITLPSDIARQRPDIRASEALLHAATASVGVATADLFPKITLTSAFGFESNVASNLFKSSNQLWSIGSGITQPLFHGGALFAKRRQAIADFDQAYANYKKTVLMAFQNVADVLKAIEIDSRTLKYNSIALDSAKKSLFLTKKQYQLGGASYLDLLISQQQMQQQELATIQAIANKYINTASLFLALGGGWWNQSWCVDVNKG